MTLRGFSELCESGANRIYEGTESPEVHRMSICAWHYFFYNFLGVFIIFTIFVELNES